MKFGSLCNFWCQGNLVWFLNISQCWAQKLDTYSRHVRHPIFIFPGIFDQFGKKIYWKVWIKKLCIQIRFVFLNEITFGIQGSMIFWTFFFGSESNNRYFGSLIPPCGEKKLFLICFYKLTSKNSTSISGTPMDHPTLYQEIILYKLKKFLEAFI